MDMPGDLTCEGCGASNDGGARFCNQCAAPLGVSPTAVVPIGARVSALAGPGEVLVTSTVKDLVIGSELLFDDRGLRTLKGVPGDWHLWAAN
jgi:hypothetical protein